MLCALYALRAVRAAQLVSANCVCACTALRAHYNSWAERRDICVISQFVVVVVNLPHRV